MSTPGIVIAAPSSGSGKTTIATGLIGALRRAGHAVAPFKVGPDFIDPGYHGLAAGRPGRNLDPVLVGDHLIGPLYRHGSADADIAVVEGVMGMFDGRISDAPAAGAARGSTAHVAGLLGTPVILVVDARGQSHSVGALVHGFATFDSSVRLVGVILNRVGSARHEAVLRQGCEQAGIAVLGAVPRTDELAVPSRHLGLVTAVEHGGRARSAVDAMADLVARHVDLAAVVSAARSDVGGDPWTPHIGEPTGAPVTVALAAGRAFTFNYAEHTELLSAAGADVVTFDPLTDPLPAHTAAVVIPGGFPEECGPELSANRAVREQIAALAHSGAPIQAECAGLTYLADDLDGHPMCGVIGGSASFTPSLTLGYRDAVAVADSSLHHLGDRIVGHEFHRTAMHYGPTRQPAWRYRGRAGAMVDDGVVRGGVHAGYLHTHPAVHPEAIARFVRAAAHSKLAG
ncbi:cobyrinate a,c-diamide synthase [Mycobacterium sp. PSTR-4-N]|uniref:cobyrinate a,c-diamide synthase n=1 Tax=Mycobacterium sp. PSTR-4-N TaxID=2917745 RepID=UPI001F1539D2|nr:cobyrinate a,c-diamide synthase [Mycobacterium sp. PSTR-4-N]MCG7594050.1 cobyrinate a,c-diamide synthase [Mycobacterium sp. PSTR-4-N]